MPQPAAAREHWSSGVGFVLASAGCAIGLGNLWGFVYRASQGGGAVFVVLYLLVVVLILTPVLVAEFVIGRSTGQTPIDALRTVGGSRWGLVGWLFVVASTLVLSYYTVLMGWTGLTLCNALLNGLPATPQLSSQVFASMASGSKAVWGHITSLLLTGLVVAAGVRRGLERLSLWFMPLLFVLLIGLVVWASGLDGAAQGYRTFLLHWDGSRLLDPTTIRNAFSQAFFSIGAGLGALMTYASYLDRRSRLPSEAVAVVSLDTAVALLAGLVVFPIVSSFGLTDQVSASAVGSGTLFIALPTGLASLGTTGTVAAVVFFSLAYVAAITSAVSMLEVAVASLIDRLGWSRPRAVWSAVAVVALLGLPSALDSDILTAMDKVFGGVALMLGGLLIALLLGWLQPDRYLGDLDQTPPLLKRMLLLGLRWTSPLAIGAGLLLSLVDLLPSWLPNAT